MMFIVHKKFSEDHVLGPHHDSLGSEGYLLAPPVHKLPRHLHLGLLHDPDHPHGALLHTEVCSSAPSPAHVCLHPARVNHQENQVRMLQRQTRRHHVLWQ